MDALIIFAIWAGLFFLMMRLGCGAHATGHGHGHGQVNREVGNAGNRKPRWRPPEKDTDPVCGKSVRTGQAKPSFHDGNVYFFCSRDCREIFEAAPDLYLGGGDPDHPKLEHSHA
jgi:YHS domain-containing protein